VQIDPDALPNDPAALQQMLRELHAENDKLRLLLERLMRHQFGRRSEQLTVDQLQLGIEDQEQTVAEHEASQGATAPTEGAKTRSHSTRAARNHGALPSHLPRYEVVIDVAPEACPCCGGKMHCIDELRTEQLDIVPAQLRVRVTRRPRYACRTCEEAVVVAEAPARPIDGGMPTEVLVAHVVVSKYCDSQPLYRQSQMLQRQGITLDRSTLSNWVGTACWWLAPLYDLVVTTVLSSPKIFADDTSLPVLDRAVAGPRQAFCGAMRWMTVRGAVLPTRRLPISIVRTARTEGLPSIFPVSKVFCRSMAMTASSAWPAIELINRSVWHSAGCICDAGSSSSMHRRSRHLPQRCWLVLPRSMRSRQKFAVTLLSTGTAFARSEVDRSSKRCMNGCRHILAGCRAHRIWQRQCAMRSVTGQASPRSSTMAASRWIPIRSSGASGRTLC